MCGVAEAWVVVAGEGSAGGSASDGLDGDVADLGALQVLERVGRWVFGEARGFEGNLIAGAKLGVGRKLDRHLVAVDCGDDAG